MRIRMSPVIGMDSQQRKSCSRNPRGTSQPLGTAIVKVHDLAAVKPGNPLMYAVRRISNMVEIPCADIKGLPLRAILSWNQQPTGPNFSPFWGNVINTHVQPIISGGV